MLDEAYSTQLLKDFTIHELAKHISTQLPPDWDGSTSHMKWSKNCPDAAWLKDLWHFIGKHCTNKGIDQIETLADWPIIPTSSQHLVSIKMAKTVIFLGKYNDTAERRNVCSALQKLGCPVVDIAKMWSAPSVDYLSMQSAQLPTQLDKILTNYLAAPTNSHNVLYRTALH
jgi:hypothetical protein